VTRNNYKRLAESRLEMLNQNTIGCRYVLWQESGVKRVYKQADGQSGYSQFGGGFLTWQEVFTFLDGARETLFAIEYGDMRAPQIRS
jgi:hypothetical protein